MFLLMKIPTEGPFRYAGTHTCMLCSVRSIIVKLSYTDAKVNPQTAKVSNVFQKCAKAACMCGVTIVNVSFHIRLI